MRKFISKLSLVLIFTICNSCFVFETCDGVRYQIKSKKDIGGGMCQFRAQSIGNCLIWNDQKYLDFTEKCSLIELSQIFDRDYLYKKYGI